MLTSQLKSALTTLTKITPPKTTMEIIKCVLLETVGDKIKLTANNLSMSLSLFIDGDKQNHNAAIPARKFNDLVSLIKEDDISIKYNNDTAKLKYGRHSASYRTMLSTDFPNPEFSQESKIELDAMSFANTIKKAIVSVSQTDDGVLSGIYIESKENVLKVASADGFRMTIIKMLWGIDDFSIVIPSESCKILIQVLKDQSKINMSVNQRNVAFWNDNFIFTSQLIDGNYPNVERIIPQSWMANLKIDKGEFVNAIKKALVFAKDSDNVVNVFTTENGLEISGQNIASENNKSLLVNYEHTGDDIAFAINAQFVLDVLSILGDKIIIKFNTKTHPIGIYMPDCETYTHIMMPMNIRSK